MPILMIYILLLIKLNMKSLKPTLQYIKQVAVVHVTALASSLIDWINSTLFVLIQI